MDTTEQNNFDYLVSISNKALLNPEVLSSNIIKQESSNGTGIQVISIDRYTDSSSDSNEERGKKRKTDEETSSGGEYNQTHTSEDKDNPNDEVSNVVLDRAVLLKMSSNAFEAFASNMSVARSLSSSEEKQLKAQRRLISNRESAQASRRRKKAYVEELEARVIDLSSRIDHLSCDNTALTNRVQELTVENISLRETNTTLLENNKT